jgi:hypothetical protein
MRKVVLFGLPLAAVLALTIYWLVPSRTNGATPTAGTTRPAESPAAADVNSTAAASALESGPTRVDVSTAVPGSATETRSSVETSARGRFVDKSGAPVEGVKVYKTPPASGGISYGDIDPVPDLATEPAVSGVDGVFRWIEPERAGSAAPNPRPYRGAVAVKLGYARVKLAMQLERGKETPLGDLVLEPGGDVAGVVRDPEGRPVAGAVVKLVEATAFATTTPDPATVGRHRVNGHRGANSSADGRFAMFGAPTGTMRLFADDEVLGFTISEPFVVQPGAVLDTFVLTLNPLPKEATIEGRVVKSTGEGVEAAIEVSFVGGAGMFETSSDGTFRWRCFGTGPYTFAATDAASQLGSARAEGVKRGDRDVRLVLPPRRELILELVNDAGEAIREGSVNVLRKEGPAMLNFTVLKFDPLGRAVVGVPASVFTLDVRSPGHANALTAEIDPARAPDQLRVVLRKLAAIEGRVVSNGKPVKGVWVAFQTAASGRNGGFPFRHRLDVMATAPVVETGPDGAFSLAPSVPVKLAFLRASPYRIHPFENTRNPLDLAAAELGPFEYDGRTPVKGLEIVMSSGGGIAGKLSLPAGRSPAGQVIGASNGDGHPVTTKTRDDGSFEFVQLTPGRFEVKWLDGSDFGNSASSTPPTQVPSVPWNCTVEEGAVTTLDLDYSSGTDPFLLLEVKLGSLGLAGAQARGELFGNAGTSEAGEAILDAEGRSRVKLPKGGSVRVTISHTTPDGVQYEIHSTVAVDGHGETRHVLDIPTGVLRGTAPATGGDGVKLMFSKLGAPPYVNMMIVVKPGAAFTIDPAPAGSVYVKLPDGKSARTTVPAGGVAEIVWP